MRLPISLIGPTRAVHLALSATAATGADRMPTRLLIRLLIRTTPSPKRPMP